MALHVTHVADPSQAVTEMSERRTAAGRPPAGQPVTQANPANLATRAAVSFDSLLASGASVDRPAAAVITAAGKHSTAATATTTAKDGTSTSSTGTSASSTTASGSGLSDFELLFGGSSYNPADPRAAAEAANASAEASAASAAAAATPPTAQSVFGANVWITDPTGIGPNGYIVNYNPYYFATEGTAQTVAQMIGGTVFVGNALSQSAGSPFAGQQPLYEVRMPNGAVINPGLVASFYTFGFSQSQINALIANEVANTTPPSQET